MKWVLALGLCSLITMFLTILIASTGKGKMDIDPRLQVAAGVVTCICTIIGSGYGSWASVKCEDKLRKTRLGFHITAIVLSVVALVIANKKAINAYGSKASGYVARKTKAARRYAANKQAAARGALAQRAQLIRQAQAPAQVEANPLLQVPPGFATWQNNR